MLSTRATGLLGDTGRIGKNVAAYSASCVSGESTRDNERARGGAIKCDPQEALVGWKAYGMGSVSPDSKLPQLTVLAPAMAEIPVITDLETQNKSVPFPETCVSGFVPVPTAIVDKLATTSRP